MARKRVRHRVAAAIGAIAGALDLDPVPAPAEELWLPVHWHIFGIGLSGRVRRGAHGPLALRVARGHRKLARAPPHVFLGLTKHLQSKTHRWLWAGKRTRKSTIHSYAGSPWVKRMVVQYSVGINSTETFFSFFHAKQRRTDSESLDEPHEKTPACFDDGTQDKQLQA